MSTLVAMKTSGEAMRALVLLTSTVLVLTACSDEGPECGPGTILKGDTCEPEPSTPIECGPGTIESAGQCVPVALDGTASGDTQDAGDTSSDIPDGAETNGADAPDIGPDVTDVGPDVVDTTDGVDGADTAETTDAPDVNDVNDVPDTSDVPDTVEVDVCVPDCASKNCGSDGCGGVCGFCFDPDASECIDGVCTGCQPQCVIESGVQACGSDGCGGNCGQCNQGTFCIEGICGQPPLAASCVGNCTSLAPAGCSCQAQCVAQGNCCVDFADVCGCLPNCVGKACGGDGCGGVCGVCSGTDHCQDNLCVADLCGPEPCSGNGACDPTDGACDCALNFVGDQCSECAEGLAGYPNCEPAVCFNVDCDDNDPCTTDECVVALGGCQNTPLDVDCADGVACKPNVFCGIVNGRSCQDILAREPNSPSGVYGVSPLGVNGFDVYCDMETDGGGWSKVVHYGSTYTGWGTGVVGEIASDTIDGTGKLSDADLNALYQRGEFRLMAPSASVNLYIRSAAAYDDPAIAWGFANAQASPVQACASIDLETCAMQDISSTVAWLDTFYWGLTPDNNDRFFMDHEGWQPGCWATGLYSAVDAYRCVANRPPGGHAPMNDFSMWVREAPTTFTGTHDLSVENTPGHDCADGGDMVAYSVIGFSADDAVTLSQPVAAGCLIPGDEVLLLNAQGATGETVNVGNYEVFQVATVVGSSVTFTAPKIRRYGATSDSDDSIGTEPGEQRVVLQRIPTYVGFTVEAGASVTVSPWNGMTGGVFAARFLGASTIDGEIDVRGLGYRGGVTTTTPSATGQQGESIAGAGISSSSGVDGGGGGGPGDGSCGGIGHAAGGGSYATMGTAATEGCGGFPGSTYATAGLSQLRLGSAGGAGGSDNSFADNPPGAAGGGGGGIILLLGSNPVVGLGAIVAAGASGVGDIVECSSASTTECWDFSGAGGGGSGGSVLYSDVQRVAAFTDIEGGAGGIGLAGFSGSGGQGGNGLSVCTLGHCTGNPATDCRAILDDDPGAESGTYWVDPDAGGAFAVHCEMEKAGGGWTMCYTTALGQNLSDLTANTGTFGSDGYQRRCAALPFHDVIYVNHNIDAWIAGTQPNQQNSIQFQQCVDECSGRCGHGSHPLWHVTSSNGTFESTNGGVQFCEGCNFKHAVHLVDQPPGVGFNACGDFAAYNGPAIRTHSPNGFYGIRWLENAHASGPSTRVVSVGVR